MEYNGSKKKKKSWTMAFPQPRSVNRVMSVGERSNPEWFKACEPVLKTEVIFEGGRRAN